MGLNSQDYVALEDFCKKNFVEIDISDLKINYKFADGKYNILQNALRNILIKYFL